MSESKPRFLSVPQVADALGIASKTVYANWRGWGLQPIRIGGGKAGALRFRNADIERLADSWAVESRAGQSY